LGHDKEHLPATQISIAVRLIPILAPLSSGWTVPLSTVSKLCQKVQKSSLLFVFISESRQVIVMFLFIIIIIVHVHAGLQLPIKK
jgi:hypothetical protein